MDIEPTFRGYIQNELDALLIFQAVLDSKLKHVPRRPYEIERPYLITSGNIFVFIEEVSGIKRWTDGITWSPSRISGKFLIYKELDRSFNSPSMFNPMNNNRHQMIPQHYPTVSAAAAASAVQVAHAQAQAQAVAQAQQVVNPYHQPNYSMQFSKYTGFVKKTISMKLKSTEDKTTRQNFHIVSYYLEDDINYHRLQRPSESPFFNDIKPSDELIKALDTSALGNGTTTTTTSVITASSNQQQQQQQQRYAYINDRKLIPDEIKMLNQQQSLMNPNNNTYHQPMYVPTQAQMWNPNTTTNSHAPTNSSTNENNNNSANNGNNENNTNNGVPTVSNNADGNIRYPYGAGLPNSNTLYSVPYNQQQQQQQHPQQQQQQQQQQIPHNRMMVNNPYQMYYSSTQPSMGGISHIPKFLISLNQQPASDANSVNNNNINTNRHNPTTNASSSSNNNNNNDNNNNSNTSNNTASNTTNNNSNNGSNSNNENNNNSNNGNDVINRTSIYQPQMDSAQQPYPINLTNSMNNENIQQMYPHLPAHVQTYPAYYGQGSIVPNNEILYANNNEPNSDKLRNGYLIDNTNSNSNTNSGTRLDAMNVPIINTTRMNNTLTGQTITESPYDNSLVPLTHKGINSSGNTNIQVPIGSSFSRDQQQQQQQSIQHPHLPPGSYRHQNR